MKLIFKLLSTLFIFIFFGCGSKPETLPVAVKPDKFTNKVDTVVQKVETKVVDKVVEKVADKAENVEKKEHVSPKKSAPVEIAFESKENNQILVTINLKKPVKDLIIQANPLDGLTMQKPEALIKSSYDEPTILTMTVQVTNNSGRLGIYVAGSFDGMQQAIGQSYALPNSKSSLKKDVVVEKDGNGELIRVMPGQEK
jgi:hypothetical protein